MHNAAAPEMVPALGAGLTVMVFVADIMPQLATIVYEIVSTPADTPVTMPADPIVAEALLLLQRPPATLFVKVIVAPGHTEDGPEITPGETAAPIVTTFVATAVPQLLVVVYFIVSVPADKPVSTPALVIVAWLLLTLHVPPVEVAV